MNAAPLSPRNALLVLAAGLASCAGLLTQLYKDAALGGDSYRQGDWLINSAAGPVRRGMLGDGFVRISDLIGASPVSVVIAVQFLLVLVATLGLCGLIWRLGCSDALTLTVLSPLVLLFWVNDPLGGLRKELIIYGALLITLWGHHLSPGRLWPHILALCLFGAGVIGHEGMGVTAPLFAVVLLWLGHPRLAVVPLMIALGVVVWVMALPPLPAFEPACRALIQRGGTEELCQGAQRWLILGKGQAVAITLRLLTEWGYLLWAPVALVLGFGPLAYLWGRVLHSKAALLALLSFVPLFAVAFDWGRWLSMMGFAVLFLGMAYMIGSKRPAPAHIRVPAPVFWGLVGLNVIWGMSHVEDLVTWGAIAQLWPSH